MNQFGKVVQLLNQKSKIVFSKIQNRWFKRFQMKGQKSSVGARPDSLYENVIKPKILSKWNIYRTYNGKDMKNIMIVDYNFKLITNRRLNEAIYPDEDHKLKVPKFDPKNPDMQGDKKNISDTNL